MSGKVATTHNYTVFLLLLVYICACVELLFVRSSFNAFSTEDESKWWLEWTHLIVRTNMPSIAKQTCLSILLEANNFNAENKCISNMWALYLASLLQWSLKCPKPAYAFMFNAHRFVYTKRLFHIHQQYWYAPETVHNYGCSILTFYVDGIKTLFWLVLYS